MICHQVHQTRQTRKVLTENLSMGRLVFIWAILAQNLDGFHSDNIPELSLFLACHMNLHNDSRADR